jgi:hypothetical protein
MATIRIKSIRLGADLTKISYDERTADEQWIHTSIESPERPLPAFTNALQDMASDVCFILEMDEGDAAFLTVTGCTFKWSEDLNKYQVVLIAKKKVKLTNSPLNIATPILSITVHDEEDEHHEFKAELNEKLNQVLYYAERYVQGDREAPEQDSLKFGKDE